MVEKVEIIIKNGTNVTLKSLVDFTRDICYINNKKYDVTDEFEDELLDTICSWKHEYGETDDANSEEFFVTVTDDDSVEKYHGKGIYPETYLIFKEMLSETTE